AGVALAVQILAVPAPHQRGRIVRVVLRRHRVCPGRLVDLCRCGLGQNEGAENSRDDEVTHGYLLTQWARHSCPAWLQRPDRGVWPTGCCHARLAYRSLGRAGGFTSGGGLSVGRAAAAFINSSRSRKPSLLVSMRSKSL